MSTELGRMENKGIRSGPAPLGEIWREGHMGGPSPWRVMKFRHRLRCPTHMGSYCWGRCCLMEKLLGQRYKTGKHSLYTQKSACARLTTIPGWRRLCTSSYHLVAFPNLSRSNTRPCSLNTTSLAQDLSQPEPEKILSQLTEIDPRPRWSTWGGSGSFSVLIQVTVETKITMIPVPSSSSQFSAFHCCLLFSCHVMSHSLWSHGL